MNQLNIFDTGTNIEKLRILDGNGKKLKKVRSTRYIMLSSKILAIKTWRSCFSDSMKSGLLLFLMTSNL